MSDEKDYRDILEREHPTSPRHPRMPLSDRAAQFAPFAALTGYDDAIDETARLTESEVTLGEDLREELDQKQRYLVELLEHSPEVSVTYFVTDDRKAGGAYRTVIGRLSRVDEETRRMHLSDGTQIPLDRILALESPWFSRIE